MLSTVSSQNPPWWILSHDQKDNNQFYDVNTGLLVGYRFESDDASKTLTFAIFEDYKILAAP